LSGKLYIVGLGPGAAVMQTPQAQMALQTAEDVVGYSTYLARVPKHANQTHHASDNGQEIERAAFALNLACAGRTVAVVSSGDAGVFAMASAVFEAVEHGEAAWSGLDIEVVPGISAMFAVAARCGAPLGHDFCAISLSDNLKPWELVLTRLRAAASAGFVIALYNPVSVRRPWQLGEAFTVLREILPTMTPVIFAAAASRNDERVQITQLGQAEPSLADMRTLIIIGSDATRLIPRASGNCWVYTPRSVRSA
jgi:precorrin-3B C17-methyltransferase